MEQIKDWTGNSRSYASVLGARNFAKEEQKVKTLESWWSYK